MSGEGHDGRIAIVGMGGRFPGARDLDAFWRNLAEGVESITFLGEDELRAAGVPEELLTHARYVPAAVLLEDVDRFDAGLFGYTPREAELMDPQHRLFLECAWTAFEDAGHDPAVVPGSVGVFAGTLLSNYLLSNLLPNPSVVDSAGTLALRIQNDKDFLATRVSYKLDLRGPSLSVQTACSSSLVAIHLACASLNSYECDMALAGGVSVAVPQRTGYLYQEGSIYSSDGHCRPFGEGASGTVNGSGVGAVVLKRLGDALADGDRVRAVILGSAINNDGALKVGFTAPSVERQAEVVAAAQEFAGVDPRSVGYVEAHGTGTPMGDPVEVAALTQVFRESTADTGFCALGSVKSNIGHLDAAAGVAGLIKTVMALEHGKIPPSLHCDPPSPAIDFPSTPFRVAAELADWRTKGPRRAGVSSLGVGGTNAHVVLEEAPAPELGSPSRPWQLLVLSGRDREALDDVADRLAGHLDGLAEGEEEGTGDPRLADVAHTLREGRRALAHRRAVVCTSPRDAAEALAECEPGQVATGEAPDGGREVVFLFSGQGSQYPGMARELYRGEAVFRRELDRCVERLAPEVGVDLRELLFPSPADEESAAARLAQTAYTQPALFALEWALGRTWLAWGVRPAAMAGHSIGEWVAACLAGVFCLDDALRLVARRGRLLQRLERGAMLGIPLSESEVQPLLGERLAVAAVNGPELVTVSGPVGAIEALEESLEARGVAARRLHTSHAFHSPLMEPAVELLGEELRGVGLRAPERPFVSAVTGTWIRPEEATDPGYWARHLVETVRFSAAVETLLAGPPRVFLEVGPGHTLCRLARLHRRDGRVPLAVPSLPHPRQGGDALLHAAGALGRLWVHGAPVDWSALRGDECRRRVALPTYPFRRDRHWIDPPPPARSGAALGTAGGDRPRVPAWRELTGPAGEPGTGDLRCALDTGEPKTEARLREHLAALGMTVEEPGDPACSLVTSRAVDLTGSEPLEPERAARLEALVAAGGGGIDLDLWRSGTPCDLEALASRLAAELREPGPRLVALRGERRWLREEAAGAGAADPPAPEPAAEPAERDGPREPLQQALVEVWEEQLGVRPIGVHDDFFELGGNSLTATQVLSRVRDRLGVDVPLRDLFETPTVARLAERLAPAAGAAEAEAGAEPDLRRPERPPLSHAQEGLWLLDRLAPGDPAYTMASAVRIRGRLDLPALRAAAGDVVARHEILRTRFPDERGRPWQEVLPDSGVRLPVVDVTGLGSAPCGGLAEAALAGIVAALLQRPFELAVGPVLRLLAVRLAGDHHVLVSSVHHIAFDVWSAGVFGREVAAAYRARLDGTAPDLPPLDVQYADYATRQRRELDGPRLAAEIEWWRGTLAGAPAVLDLPTDAPRPPVRSARGGWSRFRLDEATTDGLRRLARERGATLFMALLAAYAALLARWSGQRDLVVGTPVAHRNRTELEPMIGLFVNALALRVEVDGGTGFEGLLERVRETSLDAFAHQEVPFGLLVKELRPERDLAWTPIFQTFFALQNAPGGEVRAEGLEVEPYPVARPGARFDLALELGERDGTVAGHAEYAAELFDGTTVARFLGQLAALLEAAVAAPGTAVGALPVLRAAERHQAIVEANDTAAAFESALVPERIAARAAAAPDEVAVVAGDRHLSLAALDAWSAGLAAELRALGVSRGDRVAVELRRGAELPVALLAVLRTGAAYVPIDPAYPAERRRLMLEDSGAVAVVTDGEGGGSPVPVLRPGAHPPAPGGMPAPGPELSPEDLAYVIYTSGSTGRPKGVAVSHGALANFLDAMAERPGLAAGERLVALTTPSFDIAALELFLPLLRGARLVVAPEGAGGDPEALGALLRRVRATTVQATPATWGLLVAGGWRPASDGAAGGGLRVLCGGEALGAELAASLAEAGEAWNLYGPTEATVWASRERLRPEGEPGRAPLLGRPIENLSAHVVDPAPGPALEPALPGAPGELLLGGAGLARGYWRMPARTAERFVPDPFATGADRTGARLYRTGDLARRRPDGRLEYLGRMDDQVKVRGFRIELGEVESVLARRPDVAAVAVALDPVMAGRLAAWVVPAEPVTGARAAASVEEIRAFLGDRLPAYMVPATFRFLDALPLTANGKVDRRALTADGAALAADGEARPALEVPFEPPRDDAERALAAVWSRVLEVGRVGRDDNFFSLGGDSLRAIQVCSEAREEGWPFSPQELFRTPTVARLADRLRSAVPELDPEEIEVEDLSEEDVDALLGELLAQEEGVG